MFEDEKRYYQKDFGERMDLSSAWSTARVTLKVFKTTSENGDVEMVTNPKRLANFYNNFFRKKIQFLREKTNQPPTIPPCERLGRWLAERDVPPPPFELNPIDRKMFRRIMSKMKPKRVHGFDWKDSYPPSHRGCPDPFDHLAIVEDLTFTWSHFHTS